MVRLLRILLPLVVCSSLHAAILPEQRIAEPLRVASTRGETDLSVASHGAGAFAVWNDNRSSGHGDLFGTRLGADGSVLDPTGILIDEDYGNDPAVVWNGWSYTAIAAEPRSNPYALQRLFLYRLDRDGRKIIGRIPLGGIDAPRLARERQRRDRHRRPDPGRRHDLVLRRRDPRRDDRREKGGGLVGGAVPVADGKAWFAFADEVVCEPKNTNCKVVLEQHGLNAAHDLAKKTTLFDFERDPRTLSVASNGAGQFALAWTHTETLDLEKREYKRRVFYKRSPIATVVCWPGPTGSNAWRSPSSRSSVWGSITADRLAAGPVDVPERRGIVFVERESAAAVGW